MRLSSQEQSLTATAIMSHLDSGNMLEQRSGHSFRPVALPLSHCLTVYLGYKYLVPNSLGLKASCKPTTVEKYSMRGGARARMRHHLFCSFSTKCMSPGNSRSPKSKDVLAYTIQCFPKGSIKYHSMFEEVE